jgi:hypothetical protein
MSRKVKSVSFNQNDPFENEMYEFAKNYPNFSSFVKRLIQNAMRGKIENAQQIKSVQNVAMEQVVINPEHLKQLI